FYVLVAAPLALRAAPPGRSSELTPGEAELAHEGSPASVQVALVADCGHVVGRRQPWNIVHVFTMPPFPQNDIGCPQPALRLDGRDRKSTRLNSSHVSIEYAVHCL